MNVGALIWLASRPLIRLILTTAAGFAITKADIFPPIAARSAGQIVLNVSFPALLFSKIVPAFTQQNVSALGPLILVASIYEILGIAIAWVVGLFFWVPHRFRHGFLVAGGWSNWGDLPTAFIMSITGAAPFNSSTDPTLAVAYISVFLLVFMISLFPMGGSKLLVKDFVGPDVELEEVKEAHRRRRREMVMKVPRLLGSLVRGRHATKVDEEFGRAAKGIDTNTDTKHGELLVGHSPLPPTQPQPTSRRHRHDDSVTLSPLNDLGSSEIQYQTQDEQPISSSSSQTSETEKPKHTHTCTISPPSLPNVFPPPPPLTRTRRCLLFTWEFFKSMMNAPSISIFISFPIALLPPIKFLFVPPASPSQAIWMGKTIHIPNAPDGQPPLAFMMDTATFVGSASVPLGLICLGSALARMRLPKRMGTVEVEDEDDEKTVEGVVSSRRRWWQCRPWRSTAGLAVPVKQRKRNGGEWKEQMPIGAIMGLAIGKMLLMPVLGVLLVEGLLVRVGVIPESDKVLRFVCVFLSCLPTATTQVFLTQVYSGTGDAEFLSPFLIPQYFLMIFSMTALTAYSLNVLFP
ncbi:hypothetical protein BDN72DRAFT_828151 [Pluteus cervinus]|uniref:Uncharacterized protein n=1 Tax=Pluteus cervinus TaxID=181527 RepID=A0ACD3A9S7_9AGAR|nr:hypothetical protein BDN72DRAFT_828151 [Pluteus cervinus]